MVIAINLLIYLVSFVLIWYSAGLIVKSVEKFSQSLSVSPFTISFFILGILTSIPELFVGVNSIIKKDPQIFVGNLIGGIIVIFMFIIPILAIVGDGIKLSHDLDGKRMLLSLIVCAAPAFLISDNKITIFEAILLILLYLVLFIFFEKKRGIIVTIESQFSNEKISDWKDFSRIVFGIILVFIASRFIVIQTEYFSQLLKISPFFLSLIFLSLGTNLPELSVGIRSLYLGKKDVAFGDYIGSAAANTLIFGVLTLINKDDVIIPNYFYRRFIFLSVGLSLFYFFSRSKKNISRVEGIILLFTYLIFFLTEIT